MRKIEVYQIEQEYIAGDIRNIQVLDDKLKQERENKDYFLFKAKHNL